MFVNNFSVQFACKQSFICGSKTKLFYSFLLYKWSYIKNFKSHTILKNGIYYVLVYLYLKMYVKLRIVRSLYVNKFS